MKRTSSPSKRFETSSTTSTTGPHTLLAQNFGVVNVTTNGLCSRSVSATECSTSVRSGGTRVVTFDASPPTEARVGVSDAGAGSPTPGAAIDFSTTMFPSAWTGSGPPSGSATNQYLPAFGIGTYAT